MANTPHLQERRDDWETATDQEVIGALLDRPAFICPFWFNWVQRNRAHCLQQSLVMHRDLGGYVGAPAKRWLKKRGVRL